MLSEQNESVYSTFSLFFLLFTIVQRWQALFYQGMIFQITYKLTISFILVNLLGLWFRCILWPYLSIPICMMSCLPVCFAEDKTYSVCCCMALMICLSILGRRESTAALLLDGILSSVWQQSSNGKEQNQENSRKPMGINWENAFKKKSPILLDFPGVVTLLSSGTNEVPVWIMLFQLHGAYLD